LAALAAPRAVRYGIDLAASGIGLECAVFGHRQGDRVRSLRRSVGRRNPEQFGAHDRNAAPGALGQEPGLWRRAHRRLQARPVSARPFARWRAVREPEVALALPGNATRRRLVLDRVPDRIPRGPGTRWLH